ncbi:anaerobic sulfite reductase subunit AsrB [Candidatus Formimonas warabiya]|uniref:Anaerobic sulfite reductase subunit B n=1 Tax=Formimonas warabiya TaxID=1761012 RepID=A0A3G1KZ06_FORW1|nr:anaerobic sulfite reductase subunit AsrB [Candidatus Formimonas warabiya]ATW27712.1 anaerobic sulfite reductase subunit B [Candidatus Formimonas warabiya]
MKNNVYLPQKVEILAVIPQTEIDYTFRLQTSQIRPLSGQFLQVSLPKVGEAPISISDFTEDYLELTIRKVGKLTDVINTLKPGDHLFVRGPYGNGFPVKSFAGKHLIIAAGGTGLAPVKSIISNYYQHPAHLASLNVLAGFKTPDDILFKDEIQLWREKFSVLVTVDKADLTWPGHIGLITKYIPEINLEDQKNTQVIVVGPPLMMKFTCQEFIRRGVKEENIWVSLERKMSCGVGKCGHCKIGESYVCLDGPVFNYTKSLELLD